MKRAAFERRRTTNTWRRHLRTHADPVLCACEFQIGRFRKRHVGGCATPRCFLCHFNKLMRIPTLRERRWIATYREGLYEAVA